MSFLGVCHECIRAVGDTNNGDGNSNNETSDNNDNNHYDNKNS